MKITAFILAFSTVLGCATDEIKPIDDQATKVRFTGDDSNGVLEARYGGATMRAATQGDGIELSCEPDDGDYARCADGYEATFDAAAASDLLPNTTSLAACWVTLDHCVMGGAYCSERGGCTFDQAGSNCTALYYRYCKAWGY